MATGSTGLRQIGCGGAAQAKPWVESKLVGSMPRVAALQEAIAGEGGRVVFLLRLSPLIPFALSNYFYGERTEGPYPSSLHLIPYNVRL
jgi:hypothetical protein